MAKANERKEKLSIYLAKNLKINDLEILKLENAKTPISIEIPGIETAMLYIKKEPLQHSPPWTKLFTSRPEVSVDDFGNSSSVGAALVITAFQQKFILTFGTGFHLLNDDTIERDFGLRVTLNSVDPEKLRSLDKSSYDHNPLNSRTQSTKEVDIFDLHIDSNIEMLYAVTGVSTVEIFGSHITGRDAFTVISSIDFNHISLLLEEALTRYNQKLPDVFEWVDNINRVRDTDHIQILDLELESVISGPSLDNFWLGEPEVVDWEIQLGYSFDLYSRTERYVVLDLKNLISHLKSKSIKLSVDALKHTQIHINDHQYHSIKSWPAYKCLYAELVYGGESYILRNALWYKVNSEFLKTIDNYLSSLTSYKIPLPRYDEDREEEYNAKLATDPSFELLDKKNIKIGGVYDKLEFCDVIRNGSELIHIKYYRSSSTLSHLFSQGCVAAEAFIRDTEFREKLNSKLPPSIKLLEPALRPDPSNYKVVYAIATKKKLPSELPFFSKVTLKNALKVLRGLNYQVEIATIDIDPTLILKKKYKPK
ncbi:sporadically distributed protein, TIGR04141 family [Pseudomonas syringae group genomosp. 3]|uniref:TIGR04141 family sporadically distributed protein n=1 Tax=Pseudomonas syringae TaxID=317 RepID=UPI0004157207|nr:TIGR04141 family sporadically distributed protein [Pseudomonas syringae]POD76977.1 sporadically distributed protein, TIGR04141 family [Pseudomonas syringae group genomosp. 3]